MQEGKGKLNFHKDKTGRAKIPIDWDLVDKFLVMGGTGAQIAAQIGVHPETLYNRCVSDRGATFTDYSYMMREKGNLHLLGKQYSLAMKGDKSLLIWLGKNRLGQSDKIEQKVDSSIEVSQKSILELPDNGRRKLELSNDSQEVIATTRPTN